MRPKTLFVLIVVAVCLGLGAPALPGQGHFEIGLHYGSWSLNLLKPLFEDLAESFAEQFKNQQFDQLQEQNPESVLRELGFSTAVDFDSGGSDWGVDLRWYPGGADGSFSIGLAVERMTMEISIPRASTTMTLQDAKSLDIIHFEGAASGSVRMTPLAILLSFRWDIFPRGVVHPYFTLGAGVAGASALDETLMTYEIGGSAEFPGEPLQTIAESGRKTLAQLKAEDAQRKLEEGSSEEGFSYPGFFPFLQLHFGLKARLAKFAHLMVDFGVLDGFLLRGGIAVRL